MPKTAVTHLNAATQAPRRLRPEVNALHRRCGVYTKAEVVCQILDAVGWHGDADLSQSRLLEPGCGNGAFVVEATRRLLAAFKRHQNQLTADALRGRIAAFEIHSGEAQVARSRVTDLLQAAGMHRRTAEACARSWIKNDDFLLADLPSGHFTHAVGNPPYVRWSRIPQKLKKSYEARLAGCVARGDLFLPFLDRAFESLRPNGRCGLLCSDRWRFMAFAEGFRKKWLPRLRIESERPVSSSDAFVDDVDSYPTILVASKRSAAKGKPPAVRTGPGKTLEELGCVIRVGPALGHTPAYVLEPQENDVEPELLRPWVDGSEIKEGSVQWRGRRVVVMHDNDGKLIHLERFPLLQARLKRFRKKLRQRSIVINGAPWFRPIDRVVAADWSPAKLLVPELAKIPRIAIDRSGAVPSHGVYAVLAPEDHVEALYQKLCDGKLANAIERIAPRVKGGYVRCYRRFLKEVRV